MSKIFISYRSLERNLAEKLRKELLAAGHHVWHDVLEINVGDQIVEKIDLGLQGIDYLVLCIPSDGTTPWMNIEWMSALSRQLSGEKVKILPVFMIGGSLPTILSGTKYADLAKNWKRGVADLLRAMQ